MDNAGRRNIHAQVACHEAEPGDCRARADRFLADWETVERNRSEGGGNPVSAACAGRTAMQVHSHIGTT